jgi:hypothetical protein
MGAKSQKTVTIYGRLSWPTWTAKEAYERSLKGQYPAADIASASPDFNLLIEQSQLDKLMKHIEEEFLPYCIEQEKKGEKRDKLDAKEVKALLDPLKKDLASQTFNTPIKPVHEKTVDAAPECVATVKCIGAKGVDMELKAIVQDEDELAVPDPDILQFPVIKPLSATVHSMYPGCYVAATLNLYAYHNGKHPGFSAGVTTAVFKANGDRIGGGISVDEDDIFND